MLSGYLITPTEKQALDLFDRCAEGASVGSGPGAREATHPSPAGHAPSVLIRYAASLDNGRGFAAYDVSTLADVLELSRFGQVLSEVQVQERCPTCGRVRERAVEHRTKVFADGSYCDDVCFAAFHAEANPDDPDSWPVWARPKGPKRQVARGDERFVLLPVRDMYSSAQMQLQVIRWDWRPRASAIVSEDPGAFYILVETDASWDCPLDPVWDASVVEFKDARLEVVV